MSAQPSPKATSAQQSPKATSRAERWRRIRHENGRPLGFVVLAILITLFAVFNLDEVKVHWVVGTSRAPLIIVIVISLLVGIVLTHFGERRGRARKR